MEVAAELGISRGAVKARLHQARAALAPRLSLIFDSREEQLMTTDSAAQANAVAWVPAEVTEIRRTNEDDPVQRKHIIILNERGGDRWLPIWIGPAEATALALALEAAETARPFTYQLAANLVAAAGSAIKEVRITKLEPPIFYGSVLVSNSDASADANSVREVDARPSDAVNLALVTGAPIMIGADLFDVGPPPGFNDDVRTYPLASAEIVAEHQQRMREALETKPNC